MNKYLERITKVLEKQAIRFGAKSHDKLFDIRLKRTVEELGEVSKAERNLSNTLPSEAWDVNKTHLVEETIDLIICSLSLYAACSGRTYMDDELFEAKLKKWERNIEASTD